MKFQSVLTPVLLGTAALLLGVSSARAALTYTVGDLFLGFRSPNSAQDYLVNIGNVSQFANLSPGSSVSVNTGGSISTDLTTLESGWFGSGSTFWSISGTTYDGLNNVIPTIYATKSRSNPLVRSNPWVGRAEIGQTASVSDIQAMKGKYVTEGVAAGTPKATFQKITSNNSYAKFTDNDLTGNGSDFGLGGSIEGVAGSTTVLDFYRVNPVAGQNADYLGYFTIASSGGITFTAVPEPSTVALLGLSATAAVIFLRRRSQTKTILP